MPRVERADVAAEEPLDDDLANPACGLEVSKRFDFVELVYDFVDEAALRRSELGKVGQRFGLGDCKGGRTHGSSGSNGSHFRCVDTRYVRRAQDSVQLAVLGTKDSGEIRNRR